MLQFPTLLIGLGGIGSEVVERVYEAVPEDSRSRLAVHAFDTNVYDIDKRKGLGDRIIQTSRPWTVGMYLRQDEAVRRWFPDEHSLLLGKPVTDGAGQVRVISRLVYRAAMGANRLTGLEDEINRISRVSGDRTQPSTRVIIVSSLAGGTGAGIFLQTALYLRKRLQGHRTVFVRGVFLLPDVLVLSKTISESEYRNVRANAYACIKELDAITRLTCMGDSGGLGAPIELEYEPGQHDQLGRPNPAVTGTFQPFDFCFLFDWENVKGENLGSFEHYKAMMARTIFLQLFSPIGEQNMPQEDNQIRSHIGAQGMNRYCGAGVASLVYPCENITTYCALRWAQEGISREWRRLDDEFEEEMKRYREDLRAGVIAAQKPEIEKRYIDLLRSYALGDRPDPFFSPLHRSTLILDERGQEVGTRADSFLSAVDDLIEKTLQSDEDMEKALADCALDKGKLTSKKTMEREIEKMEASLELLREQVKAGIYSHRTNIVHRIVGRGCSQEISGADDDFSLSACILGRIPLHPVAARFVLFSILKRLDEAIPGLRADSLKLDQAIRKYEMVFDIPGNEEVERVEDRIRMALKKDPWYKRAVRNNFKDFVEEYEGKSSQQLSALRNFMKTGLKQSVYEELQSALNILLERWKIYFDALKPLADSLQQEINVRAGEHTENVDPTVVYVLATREHKEKAWEELQPVLATGYELPPEVSQRIYLGRYAEFCRQWRPRDSHVATPSAESSFREEVLDWYRQKIMETGKLKVNIVTALEEEARRLDAPPEPHVIEAVHDLDERALPFLPATTGVSVMTYAGVHPDSIALLTEEQVAECFGPGTSVVEDEAFSPHEIVIYRSHYGLEASDFPKFYAGDEHRDHPRAAGSYFLAYRDMVRQMTLHGNEVTPHLDKRWHLAAYMPDLNPAMADEEQMKARRVYLLGLIHDRLGRNEIDRRKVWEYCVPGSSTEIVSVEGAKIHKGFGDLLKAMFFNPKMVEEILTHAQNERERHGRSGEDLPLSQHAFWKGCSSIRGAEGLNILDAVVGLCDQRGGDDPRPEAERLLNCLLEEMEDYSRSVLGEAMENEARMKTSELIKKLRDTSAAFRKTSRARVMEGARASLRNILDDFVQRLQEPL